MLKDYEKDFLIFQSNKEIKTLFKAFLNILEDLRNDHENNFQKLFRLIPEEYHSVLDMADYFDENKFQHLRKKILDKGNETIKNINTDITKLNES